MVLPKQLQEPGYGWSAFILLFIVVIGIGSSIYLFEMVDDAERADLVGHAGMLAQSLDVDEVDRLTGSRADLKNPVYLKIKEALLRMNTVSGTIESVHLVGVDDRMRVFSYADSEKTTSSLYLSPGWTYSDSAPGAVPAVFRSGKSDTRITSDTNGYWLTAYVPVVSRFGLVAAVVVVRANIQEYLFSVLSFVGVPLFMTIFSFVIISALQSQRKREYRFMTQRMELLSIASHEIRTPLTGMKWAWDGYLKEHGAELAPADRDILARATQNCTTVIIRIGDILTSTAYDSRGRNILKKIDVPMRALAESIINNLSLAAQSRGVSLVIDPSITESTMVHADRDQMYNIFFNLITNAIKYTNPNTAVTFSYEKRGDDHVFSITDHGNGMEKEETDHIFEGFYRTESAKASGQQGTGLGLYLVKKAVELHEGTISVKSELGKGTTFEVSIPSKPKGRFGKIAKMFTSSKS